MKKYKHHLNKSYIKKITNFLGGGAFLKRKVFYFFNYANLNKSKIKSKKIECLMNIFAYKHTSSTAEYIII